MTDKLAFAKGDRVRLVSCSLEGTVTDLVKEKGDVIEYVIAGQDAKGRDYTCREAASGLVNLTRQQEEQAALALAAEAAQKKAADVEGRIADAVANERARLLALTPEDLAAERAAIPGDKK